MFTESFWLINWLNKEKVKDKKNVQSTPTLFNQLVLRCLKGTGEIVCMGEKLLFAISLNETAIPLMWNKVEAVTFL